MLIDVIEGRMEGENRRGRKRIGMIDDLREKGSYTVLKRRAKNRGDWRGWTSGICHAAEH